MDLACPVVAAQDSCSPVPAGDLHMGDAPPDLVKNTSPAKAPVVGGFSECASILTSDSLIDLVLQGGHPPHSRRYFTWEGYLSLLQLQEMIDLLREYL